MCPTISNYWDAKIEAANTIAKLNSLQLKIQVYHLLVPACGSGNFLYLAYQELKDKLEFAYAVMDGINNRKETRKHRTERVKFHSKPLR